jgi:hypothetical protein
MTCWCRLGDRIDHDAHRTALRGIEAVGDELELRDRIAAEPRLAEACAGDAIGHLLTVHIDLKGHLRSRDRCFTTGVRATARREQSQIEPVAAIEWQLLHLTLIDVGGRR